MPVVLGHLLRSAVAVAGDSPPLSAGRGQTGGGGAAACPAVPRAPLRRPRPASAPVCAEAPRFAASYGLR